MLAGSDRNELRRALESIHPADVADLLADLSPDQFVALFDALPDDIASEVLDETPALVRQALVERTDDRRLGDLLSILPEDDAAAFLSGLRPRSAERLIAMMRGTRAAKVRELLAYEPESAGRLMVGKVAVLQKEWSVADAFDYLRSLGSESETLYYLYVLDHEERLVGVVPLRQLLLAQPDVQVSSLMRTDLITVPATADREELADRIARYDFVALPVVGSDDRLLGVVTVDDALDVLTEEATEDMQRLGGSEPLAAPYFSASIARIVGKRLVWLVPLFAASLITDLVIGSFEGLLAQAAALAIFIPVVSGSGGNAGSQTVATIIRAMGTNDLRPSDARRAWQRETVIGLALGLCLGGAGYLRALWVGVGTPIALVLGLTLPVVITMANMLATLVPLSAERLHVDPAVVSTPMIATIIDALGILIYLMIAAALVPH